MIELISTQPAWFWLCLGGLLLIGELLGTGGYLLWSGIAAVAVGIIAWAMPFLGWEWQGILFAVFTVVSAVLWRKWLSHRKESKADDVNQISHQLIGIKARLLTDTEEGFSRVRLADGSWRIYSEIPLKADTEVEVIAVDGITLKVKPYSDDSSHAPSGQ
ncbi:Inner membrane protein ybbJ [Providencia rustigianii]|uniref:Nodulation efficiency protein D n=2 Tax=Providencia rustigianii TaxID=158850 RepID=D1P4E0_9GAMM|nr:MULTISPECIES: NfeD family protein [Providencia]EFB71766.1 nodulation efficiency protein D [Providencia rustigianii DSM 4541]MTC55485.1 NfeD family protein [Providencia rustigianii]MTC60110.1 NfeD family protein [Providencia rustigianii]SPY78468.1 Inner membrane protein ybbJ [Providencia rustigianii]SUC36462.1 Inner membrane protein ybbJ [Providencia rustigianii]